MNYLVDTCVLFPTVMRTILLEAVKSKRDNAFWSEKILKEWSASAKKSGELGQLQADAEISILRAYWPNSIIDFSFELEESLYLPDLNDRHVLAAAIVGKCDAIITLNKKDFPRQILNQYGLIRLDPDYLILEYLENKCNGKDCSNEEPSSHKSNSWGLLAIILISIFGFLFFSFLVLSYFNPPS